MSHSCRQLQLFEVHESLVLAELSVQQERSCLERSREPAYKLSILIRVHTCRALKRLRPTPAPRGKKRKAAESNGYDHQLDTLPAVQG